MSKKSYKDALKDKMKKSNDEKDYGGSSSKQYLNTKDLDTEKIFFKPKKGKNLIDVIPFVAATDNSPRCKKGEVDYLLDVYVHRSVGPGHDNFLCLQKNYKKPCPICEHIEELKKDGEDEELIKELKAKRRVVYNVIDLNAEKQSVQLFETSHFKFEKEVQEEAETDEDGELVIFFDPEDGMSVSFRGVENSFNKKEFIEIKKVALVDREDQYKESIVEKAHALDSLLVIPSYDDVAAAFFGTETEEDKPAKSKAKDDDDEDDDRPAKKKKQPEPEDDDDDDEPAPPKKSAKKKADDDDEEEEEKPKSKKSSGKCPHGHIFGKDCDKHDECEDCDGWDKCTDEFDKLKKNKAGKNEKEDDDE